jgi:catechol 2,3-dioxygenase-like lactoylglutathione lyase family enzyme
MANLAVKVADLDAACAYYEAAGAEIRDRMAWNGAERADVLLGPVQITLFTDDLDAELDRHQRAGHDVVWGPEVVEGPFGRRRIAFVTAPGGIRLELMEQLEEVAR